MECHQNVVGSTPRPAREQDTPVAIAWVLISVGLNLWMNRAHFLDFAAKFRIRTLSAKLPVGAGWQGWQSRKSTVKEKKFKAQEDKARFSVSRRFLHVAQCSCAILLAALLFLSLVFGIPAGFACYSLSFTMVFFSLIDSGLFPVTMVSFDACLALASLAWTAVIAFSAVTPAALVQIGGRTVCRVILSLAFCNPQMSNLCLATFSSVHLYKLYNFVIMDPYLSGAAGSLVANEVAVFIIITMIVATFNGCIKESVHARVQVLVAQSCERSSKKLLSVLCEAVVTLGPDLRIAGSCRNLSHMLMAGFGSRSGGLRGALFTSLLAQGDRQRFEDFIHGFPCSAGRMIDDALSDSSGTSTDSRPPGSLRVHLRDAGGLHFLVDIFHVTIPNSDDTSTSASHLIGIKEEPGAPRLPELLPPSVFPGLDLAPGVHQADDAWSSSPSATGQELETSHPQRLTKALLAAQGGTPTASGSLSQATSRSEASGAAELKEIESISLTFDLMSPGFTIREARIRFQPRSDGAGQLPCVQNWVPQSCWQTLRTWVQAQYNAVSDGKVMPQPELPSVEMLSPSRPNDLLHVQQTLLEMVHDSREADPDDAGTSEEAGDADILNGGIGADQQEDENTSRHCDRDSEDGVVWARLEMTQFKRLPGARSTSGSSGEIPETSRLLQKYGKKFGRLLPAIEEAPGTRRCAATAQRA
ncbi:unnamed protein product [Polarella glacialis]|uniref:Uncharacterized protein n=1 Tax=Polarella glacialis TaxID=89957 RepID=A0A813EY04_POLGL|nr:unnamed protein product [Polarella glacialis]CAE8645879.1 unnamed protein product [Polarella glacialis]